MKSIRQRILAVILALSLLLAPLPTLPTAAAADPETVSLQNGNIQVLVSTENGGFLVRTEEGDVLTKDDNNRDLLYHRAQFDTSFASFVVTAGGRSQEYVFGNDYSFLGRETSLSVQRETAGICAIWTVDDLVFTQLLEPVSNESSNEHGTVKISYTVENRLGTPIAVKARLLLDTALGEQDYAYYELAESQTPLSPLRRVEQELVLSEPDDYLPANFFAYDDYENPTMAAYTICDQSAGAIQPYQLAFGHWNNLAATVFAFSPDGDLTFTNQYNKQYLTADSAFALYYDLGTVASGAESGTASTYYGVDSKVRVKAGDSVGITVTSPPGLELDASQTMYLEPGDDSAATGTFEVTSNITNLNQPGAATLRNVTVAVLVDDGLTPLDGSGNQLDPLPTNKAPYVMELGDLPVGGVRQLTWKFRADVLATTSYRKIVFRAYDTSGVEDGQLLMDNLLGSATTYLLCPGGDGELPPLTFTSAGPRAIYCEGTRHLYLTGSGFAEYLQYTDLYQLIARPKGGGSEYVIPKSNIIYSADEPGVLEVVLEDSLQVGEYELVIIWNYDPPFGSERVLTSPALSFLVTADEAYRNDYYGIVAVVKSGSGAGSLYSIKMFADEREFAAYTGDVLLEFRGKFVATSTGYFDEVLACSAVASADTDTITINQALDFEHGNIQIYRLDSGDERGVMVEFDGDLYTSNSRTAVWSGNASLTPLLDGTDYGLIKYDELGERIVGQQPDETISLVWPSGFNMLQTIGGFAVDFRYGQFGAIYTDDACTEHSGYVVSFGGKLDLSFLMPGGTKQAEQLERDADETETSTAGDELTVSPSDQAKAENEQNKVKPVGKVNIEDVLFGNGSGYLGFNSQVELMLPKYVQVLPAMGGKLEINTVGGYQVGVLGKVKTVKFELEFELKVRNAPNSNAPIPDKIYFYMDGFEPGVNVDGAGALWLTGAGGGIDRLYETIFSSGVPPLTLLLSTSFDVVKVMSGRADLALSLNGFQMKLSDVKLKRTNDVIIKTGQLGVEWSPDFLLQLSGMIQIYDTIEGRAYLVVDGDFFEMFLRASVKVPKDVKIVGGMTVGNVDLGGNNDKLWGTLSALGTSLGITYYWGGDVEFGSGNNAGRPTYPELLGIADLPVGVDPDTGETLYLRVGTNLSAAVEAELVEDLSNQDLMLLSIAPTLTSKLDRLHHQLNLGDSSADDAALTIRFTGDDRPKTILQAQAAVTFQKPDGSAYNLRFYDGTNPATANANLVVDDALNTAAVSVTITDYVAGDWNITTSAEADLVLYTISPLPVVTGLTAALSGDSLNLTWSGAQLDETELSFYLTDDVDNSGELGTLIGTLGGTTGGSLPESSGQSLAIQLPADLQTGDYYLRMIASKEDQVNQSVIATSSTGEPFVLHHVNDLQPDAPADVSLQNSGNNLFELTVGRAPVADFDGYSVSIYERTAAGLTPTDFIGLTFAKDETGVVPRMLVGGSYTTTDGQTYGLSAGKSYLAQVSAYREIAGETGSEGTVYSAAAASAATELWPVTPPVISFLPEEGSYRVLTKTVQTGDDKAQTITVPTFTTNTVQFTLSSDVAVSGQWSIDGALSYDALDSSSGLTQVEDVTRVDISRQLCDGEHVLNFSGTDAYGDSFAFSQLLAADTMPPRLMLTSPTNGSFFAGDGGLLIEGIGDADATYTILVDGTTRVTGLRLPVSNDGRFTYQLQLDPGVDSHQVTVMASDAVGNSVSATATVSNAGLAEIQRVDILVDGLYLGEQNIDLNLIGKTGQLSLRATTALGQQFVIRDERLQRWTAVAKAGSAEVEPDGAFTIKSGSIGYLLGELRVADGASMDSAIAFGAENYGGEQVHLVLRSGVGGTVSGGGSFLPGATVTLTAVPLQGYRFAGWTSSAGGSFADARAATTGFTMPANATVVTAMFTHVASEDTDDDPPVIPDPVDPGPGESGTEFAAGAVAAITIPATLLADPNRVVAYYLSAGREVVIPMSLVIAGQLVFVAPVSAVYYLKSEQQTFADTVGHWAKGAIDFAVARGLLGSVGGERFAPQGTMTRAMFVTMLSRLDGADLSGRLGSRFIDAPLGSWFGPAVDWAVELGITHGVGSDRFGANLPITREQMAVMIVNYLRAKGHNLATGAGQVEPFADQAEISSWAVSALQLLRSAGILGGKPGNLADPRGLATRAEMAVILERLVYALVSNARQ